jgi:hypothetical protein
MNFLRNEVQAVKYVILYILLCTTPGIQEHTSFQDFFSRLSHHQQIPFTPFRLCKQRTTALPRFPP